MFIATGTVLTFFGLAIALARNSRNLPSVGEEDTTQSAPESASPPADTPAPNPAENRSQFMLENFHRSETRDGRKLWEVTAARGQYYPETQRAQVESAVVWFFRDNNEKIKLSADRASLILKGSELESADTSGAVVLIYNDSITLETDRANFSQTQQRIDVPSPVKITGENLNVSGDSLQVDLSTNAATVSGNVRTVLLPKEKS